jgi:hypothetical protein
MFIWMSAHCQSIQQEQMQKLNHFIGDWVGTSTAIKNDSTTSKIPAYEKISFKVDNHILTIDLYSESLKLHTVIYYDEEAETYVYNPFYKGGAAKYPAKLVNGKLIVSPSKTKRFIFEINEEGSFREYGEIFENGEWTMYFEDLFEKQ